MRSGTRSVQGQRDGTGSPVVGVGFGVGRGGDLLRNCRGAECFEAQRSDGFGLAGSCLGGSYLGFLRRAAYGGARKNAGSDL
jgi:hypothetical protein